jgi:transposase
MWKTFNFVGSDQGSDRAQTAKLNGLDPEAYIAAVIDRMTEGLTSKALETLLPLNFGPTKSKSN